MICFKLADPPGVARALTIPKINVQSFYAFKRRAK